MRMQQNKSKFRLVAGDGILVFSLVFCSPQDGSQGIMKKIQLFLYTHVALVYVQIVENVHDP